MNAMIDSVEKIEAREVPEEERLEVLPRHFGRHMLRVEHAVYHFMGVISPGYCGGFWNFVELSNGGFYMAPAGGPVPVRVEGNGYNGQMSAEAAGITACLFALNYLSSALEEEGLPQHFYWLYDFAAAHPEGGKILAAID